jgi:RimJ/RimL family protein N-acetyltransferase
VELRPLGSAELPLVEPWFADPDTQRWLGGPSWPRQMLELAHAPLGVFRGAVETGRYRWLGWDGARAVGYIDCGTHDRWTTWDGGPGGRGVVDSIPGPAAGITYVVDPTLRRRGYATAMVRALLALPELAHVRVFGAGVEPDNTASVRCLLAAGFHPPNPQPDWEGVVYYLRHASDVMSS